MQRTNGDTEKIMQKCIKIYGALGDTEKIMQKCTKIYGAHQGGWRGPAALKSGHTEIQMQKCIMIYGDGIRGPERSLGGYTHVSFKSCRFTKEKKQGRGPQKSLHVQPLHPTFIGVPPDVQSH